MNWIYRVRPITAMLVFILMLTGEATAADVTRLSGDELKPDAFADGVYGMVYYQSTGGEWYYFSGYVTATSGESVSLRQSGFNRRTIPLQRIHSALIGPSRQAVEKNAERWRRNNLAQQLNLPLESEASLTYLPTAASIETAHQEVTRRKLPVSLLANPDFLRGRFYGRQQAGRDASTSFRVSLISGAIGGMLSSLLWLEDVFSSQDGRTANRFKRISVGAASLALPVYTSLASARPNLSEPSPYVLGYSTGFNTRRGAIRMGAACGWLVGIGVGIAGTAIMLSDTVIH